MPHTGAYSRVHTLSHVHSFWPDSSFFTHFPNGWQGGMQIKSSRETNKNIFFFGQWGSYNCLFFSLTSQQPIKGSKFFVPMEIVENVHPMTRLKFLISSAQSPYNIQSIQYYSSITKLNLWSRSNYFFLFCLCPIFRQKNWYITHHNNLLHSRCLDSSAFGFVPQYSSWWKPYTGRKSVAWQECCVKETLHQ